MTWYRRIHIGEPFEIGLDDAHRIRFVCNLIADKAASDTFDKEILALLIAAGAGTLGTNLFLGSLYTLPVGDGPYLQVIRTAGRESDETHNSIAVPSYVRPGAQILSRGKTYGAVKGQITTAYNALRGVVNRNVTPIP
jgi:hypothetical protein